MHPAGWLVIGIMGGIIVMSFITAVCFRCDPLKTKNNMKALLRQTREAETRNFIIEDSVV